MLKLPTKIKSRAANYQHFWVSKRSCRALHFLSVHPHTVVLVLTQTPGPLADTKGSENNEKLSRGTVSLSCSGLVSKALLKKRTDKSWR